MVLNRFVFMAFHIWPSTSALLVPHLTYRVLPVTIYSCRKPLKLCVLLIRQTTQCCICKTGESCGDERRQQCAKSSGLQGRREVQAAPTSQCWRQRPNEQSEVIQRAEGRAGVFLHRAQQKWCWYVVVIITIVNLVQVLALDSWHNGSVPI